MANVSNCNLANYGYDFVVSTTQASMNSDMKAFISNAPLNFSYYCFLADPETNDPTVPIALQDLINQAGGANPFDIPDGTPHTDSRVQALTNARFAVGIKICVGLPQDIPPAELPDILELGDSISQMTFRIFCTQSAIIQNTEVGDWSASGNWSVWNQPANQLWAFETSVNLVAATVDNQLISENVNLSPSQKQQVLSQLQNISSTGFTLQQLFLDVENADVLSAPTIEGMAAGPAQQVLSGQATNFWPMFAKQCTYPAVAIIAQSPVTPDVPSIQVSSFQQVVNPFKSSNGGQILSPTKEESGVATLDYLCMANWEQPPVAEAFTWNWVQPSDIDSESGLLAINRAVWVEYLFNEIVGQATQFCVLADPVVGDEQYDYNTGDFWDTLSMPLTPFQVPQTACVLPDGNVLINIEYTSAGNPATKSTHGSICGSTKCELDIVPAYTCSFSIVSGQLVVTQQCIVGVTLDVVGAQGYPEEFKQTLNLIDTTITDSYQMSADQSGRLEWIIAESESVDNSSNFGQDLVGWAHADDLEAVIRAYFEPYLPTPFEFKSTPDLSSLQSYIFPGGNVFTYKDVSFSQAGDLLCTLTYLEPEEAVSPPVTPQEAPAAEVISAIQPPKEDLTISAAPSVSLTLSSDMIQSYIPGQIVNAASKFEALQTDDGHSILLGLSSSNVLQAIVEQSGATSTGWQQIDITSAAVASNFPNDPSAVVKTFDANQSPVDNTISMAAIVTSGGTDNLLLSLDNPHTSASWATTTATSLTWKLVPFDAASNSGKTLASIAIENVMFAEATFNGTQYIIVDIDRSSTSTVKDIARYYVNPAATENCWMFHDVPVDIQAGNYQSCIGRFSVDSYGTDAVFTSGTTGTSAQLVYVPLSNPFGAGPPLIRTLSLPGGAQATAIATSRASDGSTDFFAIGGSTLYMFAADSAPSVSVATTLFSSSFFSGTDQLRAMTDGSVTTIWGRNTSNQIYYVSCPNGQFTTKAAWSTPLPLVTGIDQISAFINHSCGSNTIFAAGGETIRRLEQATNTGAKLWRQEALVLQPQQVTSSPLSFNSYTTTIQVSDEQGLPAGDISVSITTASRAPVYINGVYYVLGSTATIVVTDKTGIVTVVESAHKSINGTTLTVTCCGQTDTIDPTEKHFQTISLLGTADALSAATIQTNVRVGGTFGPSKTAPLVDASTPAANLSKAATSLASLNSVYGKVKTGASPSPGPSADSMPTPAPTSVLDIVNFSFLGDIGNFFTAAAGDVFHALKTLASDVVHVVHIVEQAASGVWHFVVTIAGQAYHAILDTVEAIVGAVEWVFKAIETGIEDIIRFLEFLLEWDDITRTKDIIHNLTQLCLQGQIDLLPTGKTALNTGIASLETQVNAWAGDSSWMTQIGQAIKQPISANAANPTTGQTSGSQMLATHYKNNASNLAIVGTPPADDSVQQLFDDLLTALDNEGKTLTAAYSEIVELSKRFTSQPFEDSLKQLVGIVADVMLLSFENVGDALLDCLITLSQNAMSLLNTNIHIPVISDILNALGVPPLSILDLFCWIPAVAFTMVYKIATGNAPFPNNSEVNSLKNAQSWSDIQALLGVKSATPSIAQQSDFLALAASESSPLPLSQEFRKDLYVFLHTMGAFQQGILTFVSLLEVELPSQDNPYSKPKTIITIIRAAFDLIAELAVPQDPIQDETLKIVSYAQVATKIVAPLVLGRNKKSLAASGTSAVFPEQDGRARGAMVKVIIGYWGVLDTVLHLFELSNEAENSDQTGAILIETSSLLGQVSAVSYCEAVNDPEAKEEAFLVMGIVGILQAGLQAALCSTV
ncbi:hypothetical protein FVER53590_09895 [Fusarium verticillioides]|nr:hypothetical protein FVER53590_09895 [Fusarium verticillioides]